MHVSLRLKLALQTDKNEEEIQGELLPGLSQRNHCGLQRHRLTK